MAIDLQKGEHINIEKSTGERFSKFCVGVNWGAIDYEVEEGGFLGLRKRTVVKTKDVDLDLSCVLYNKEGELVDYLYSPLYRPELLTQFELNMGKLTSRTGALKHLGDDKEGDKDGNDELDNEIITVDLSLLGDDVFKIFFFLNSVSGEDFSEIPYVSIRIYEGTPFRVDNEFAMFNVESQPMFRSKRSLIMGELYKKNKVWKFNPIGEAYEDVFLGQTIQRITQNYAK